MKYYKAKSADVIGDVRLFENVNIWYGAVLRGDASPIIIGQNSNMQDNAVLHVENNIGVEIGENVTVGHGAIVHAASIGDYCLVGMNATILSGAKIGKYSIIGAQALVTEGKEIPPYSLVVGVPGKVVREVTKEEIEMLEKHADEYVEMAKGQLAKFQIPNPKVQIPR
jgi:carbonic anhydrase/acetyltransferase-like protein (isoleucine patch superfamily)